MTDSLALFAHRGTRAVQRMVEHAPATGGLALWMQHLDLPDRDNHSADRSGPPVTTNGVQLRYSAHFGSLPLAQQTSGSRTRCCTSHCATRSVFWACKR